MQREIQWLIKRLEEIYGGNPWFGPSLWSKINAIEFKHVNYKPVPNIHSLNEIVQHMIAWRIFVIRKLEGDEDYNIELNDTSDWPNVPTKTEEDWSKLVLFFQETQRQLTEMLSEHSDDFLLKEVPKRQYSFRFLLEGLIEHDIYHLGQISLIFKIASRQLHSR